MRPPGSPPIPDWYLARIEATRPRFYAIARERYGLEINEGPFGISSRAAHIGGQYAEAQGVGEAYHEAVLRAYWHEARDISDTAVLAEVATTVGLDSRAYLAALDEPVYVERVMVDVAEAFDYGLNGVPALVFGRKYLVSGAQPYALLRQVTEQLAAETV